MQEMLARHTHSCISQPEPSALRAILPHLVVHPRNDHAVKACAPKQVRHGGRVAGHTDGPVAPGMGPQLVLEPRVAYDDLRGRTGGKEGG